eukprot:2737701-Karenia_brevis.AAC.1
MVGEDQAERLPFSDGEEYMELDSGDYPVLGIPWPTGPCEVYAVETGSFFTARTLDRQLCWFKSTRVEAQRVHDDRAGSKGEEESAT